MTPNMSNLDRSLRIGFAALLGFLYLSGTVSGFPGIVLMVVALVFVATSVISFCPLYKLAGFNTRRPKSG